MGRKASGNLQIMRGRHICMLFDVLNFWAAGRPLLWTRLTMKGFGLRVWEVKVHKFRAQV